MRVPEGTGPITSIDAGGGEDGNASVVAVDIVLVVGDDVRRPSSASSMDVMVGISRGVIYRTYIR